jgi:hypothetical protein
MFITNDEFGMYISTYISLHLQFTWILNLQTSVCQLPFYEVNKSGNKTTNWHKKLHSPLNGMGCVTELCENAKRLVANMQGAISLVEWELKSGLHVGWNAAHHPNITNKKKRAPVISIRSVCHETYMYVYVHAVVNNVMLQLYLWHDFYNMILNQT